MLRIANHRIDCHDTGPENGPVLLFVPGSFSTRTAWRAMQAHLPPGYRHIATSLCGYGDTDDTRTRADPDMRHLVHVVQTVADHVNAPVHLVGHSFGGTAAFATALAGQIEVRSIATFEANPFAVVDPVAHGALLKNARQVAADFETAVKAGEHDAASRIIDFWGGAGSFQSLPDPVQEYCRATAPANVLDWHTAFSFPATSSDYARLNMPTLLVRGEDANPLMTEITRALGKSLPNAQTHIAAGASHFLITTHPKHCARLLTDFLAQHVPHD